MTMSKRVAEAIAQAEADARRVSGEDNVVELPRSGGPPLGPLVVSVVPRPWPEIDEDAYYGLAGDVVRTIEPHSEADPAALLLQFLVMAGNAIGSTPYYQVESDRHHVNLNAALVGDTSKGRKGTAMGRIRNVMQHSDPTWCEERIKGGLSSGEGLIHEVRDEVKRWDAAAQAWEIIDPGVKEKRLLLIEPEFAGVLAVASRQGNTLSTLIRRAWDGDRAVNTHPEQRAHCDRRSYLDCQPHHPC